MRQKASEKLAKILPDIKYHGTLRTSVSADDFGVGREGKQESETVLSVRKKWVNLANKTIMRSA